MKGGKYIYYHYSRAFIFTDKIILKLTQPSYQIWTSFTFILFLLKNISYAKLLDNQWKSISKKITDNISVNIK